MPTGTFSDKTITFIVISGPSLWNSLPAALRRPEMTLHTFKRQLKAYLFHIWCADKQKVHPPPPGAVVAYFVILVPDTKLSTYLLTYLLYVQWLWFLTAWLIHTHIYIYTQTDFDWLYYYGSSDSWAENAQLNISDKTFTTLLQTTLGLQPSV